MKHIPIKEAIVDQDTKPNDAQRSNQIDKQCDTQSECIEYIGKIHSLTIFFSDFEEQNRGEKELLHFLELSGVFYAADLGEDYIVYQDRVFRFSDLHKKILVHAGKVTLTFVGKLIDIVNVEKDQFFIQRYYKRKYNLFVRK